MSTPPTPQPGHTERDETRRRLALALRQIGALRLLATAAFLVLAVLAARYSGAVPLADSAEHALYDLRALIAAPATGQDPRIALVVFNDATLAKLRKRSPLDRGLLAKALTRIDAMGPKAIGIDILIDKAQPEDPALLAALRGLHTPTHLAFASNATNPEFMQPAQEAFLRQFLDGLGGSRVSPASILIEPDADGVLRGWPPQPPQLPPLLSASMAPPRPAFAAYHGAIVFRRARSQDQALYASFPIEMFAEPQTAAVFRPLIAGRYVLVGAQLSDSDLQTVPASLITQVHPAGLEVHADLLAQMLDNRVLAPVPFWALWLAAVVAVLAGAATSLVQVHPVRMAAALAVQLVVLIGLPLLLQSKGFDTQPVPQFGWAAGWLIAYTASAAAARSVGSDQRRYAQAALGKYLPRDVAAEILRDPNQLKLHGERREIYAVFTDLQGFTNLSHGIEPEQVASLLNRYLQLLSDRVLEHGGTIDKFVGDAVVSFWGAPLARPDDGERAAQAAIALWQAGETFRRTAPAGSPPLGPTRVGLHRGAVVVGNFGGEGRIQYTALGDAMNTAARLESANKQLDTRVLVSREAAPPSMIGQFRSMGRVVLRGRATPIEVMEAASGFPADACERLNQAYARFDAGDVAALDQIKALAGEYPADLALQNLVRRLETAGPGGSFILS